MALQTRSTEVEPTPAAQPPRKRRSKLFVVASIGAAIAASLGIYFSIHYVKSGTSNTDISPVILAGGDPIVFSPDGKILVGHDNSPDLASWSTETFQRVQTFKGLGGAVSSLAISPDGQTLMAASWTSSDEPGMLAQWDLASGQLLRSEQMNCKTGPEARAIYNPVSGDYATLCGYGDDQYVSQWTPNGGLVRKQHLVPLGMQIAYSPDGGYLAAAGMLPGGGGKSGESGAFILMWNAHSGNYVRWFSDEAGGGGKEEMKFSPDGHILAEAEGGKTIALFDSGTGKLLRRLTVDKLDPSYVYAIAFSPDSRFLASAGGTTTIHLWDVATARLIKTLQTKDDTNALAFSPISCTLASAGGSSIQFWDLTDIGCAADGHLSHDQDNPQPQQSLDGSSSSKVDAALSPNGSSDAKPIGDKPMQGGGNAPIQSLTSATAADRENFKNDPENNLPVYSIGEIDKIISARHGLESLATMQLRIRATIDIVGESSVSAKYSPVAFMYDNYEFGGFGDADLDTLKKGDEVEIICRYVDSRDESVAGHYASGRYLFRGLEIHKIS